MLNRLKRWQFYILKVQTIVDHHHAIDQNRTATKVRFTEPAEEKDEFNDDDAKVITVLAFCICATSWLIEN